MKNFKQLGVNINIVVAFAIKSGDPVMAGAALFGVANLDSAPGETNVITTQGVFDLPKATGQSIVPGTKLYYDDAAKLLTSTPGSLPYVAVAEAPAVSAATKISARLNGMVI